MDLAKELGLNCIRVFKMDATKALQTQETKEISLERCQSEKAKAREKRKAEKRRQCKQEPEDKPAIIPKGKGFAPESFDAVLCDAPCSAMGLRPRLSFNLSIEELEATAQYQKTLLTTAAPLVKPGGVLVYSTCTIHPSETTLL